MYQQNTFHRVGVSKNSSKKTIVRFINRKKKIRKNSSLNCNVLINENLTVKTTKSLFLVKKLNVVVILIKYIKETERCIFQVWKYTE